MKFRISDRLKLFSIFMAVILIFNGLIIFNTVVSADDVTVYDGDTLQGWELDAYWTNGRKSIAITSSREEDIAVKLTVEYYAPISARNDDLPPGSISFSIPDIGCARRSGAPFTPLTTVANIDSIWNVEYDPENELYIFKNKVTIEKDKPISGGFEMLWKLKSRECVTAYEVNRSPVFTLGNEATNMTPLEFRLDTLRDYYRISLSRSNLSYVQYINENIDNDNYISYNYHTLFSPLKRARADDKSTYFVKISLKDMNGEPVEADDATMQSIIVQPGTNNEAHLSKIIDPVTNQEVWGFYRFKDRVSSVLVEDGFIISYPNSFENTYLPLVETEMIVHYLDEDSEYVYNSRSTDLAPGETLYAYNMEGIAKYSFTYENGNFSSYKTCERSEYEVYDSGQSRLNEGRAPDYPKRMLAKKIYNNEKVTFTIGGRYRVKTSSGAGTVTRKTTSSSAGVDQNGDIQIGPSDGGGLNSKFDFVLGDDRLSVVRDVSENGYIESMVEENEYNISRLVFPKQGTDYEYDVYVSNVGYDSQTERVANNRPGQNDYKKFDTGRTGTEKVFDFTDIASKSGFENYTQGVKAVYVRIKNVRADIDYSVSYDVDICFHFDEETSRVHAGGENAHISNIGYMRAFMNGSAVNCCATGAENFLGSFTDNIMKQDAQAYNDGFVTNVSGSGAEISSGSISGMEMLYHTKSNVYLRDLTTVLTSYTRVTSTALSKAEGGGFKIDIQTSGSIVAEKQEQESVNEMKKFSLYTRIPPFLTIDNSLSSVKLINCSGTDIYGHSVPNSEFESNVSFRLITYPNGDKVIASDFDFSDNPLDISMLTSLYVSIPASILYTDYKSAFTKSFNVYSYTMLQDKGVGKIVASTNPTTDTHDFNNNGKTNEIMASSADGKSYDQIVEEWEDTTEKFVKSYRDDIWRYYYDSTRREWYSETDVNAYSPILDAQANKRATYSYRLSVDLGSHSSDIVFTDIIESEQDSEWHGRLDSLDMTYAKSLGLVPTVYYSTEEKVYEENLSGDVYASYTSNLDEFTSANASEWSADGKIWNAPVDNIRSIVVRFSTSSIPSEMIQGKQVYFIMNLTAPEEDNNICPAGSIARNGHRVIYTVNGSYMNSRRTLTPNPAHVRLVPAIVMVTLRKTDSQTGNILPGAEFSFYTDTNDTPVIDWKGDVVAQNLPVNALGELAVDCLIPGLYYMKETKAPPGYQLDTNYYEIDLRGTVSNPASDWHYNDKPVLDFKNDRLYGKIVLTKKDADDPEVTGIAGAEYELYDASGIKIFTNENNEYVETEGTKSVFTTDENGVLEIDRLPWGGYYLKEITPPPGYELNPQQVWAIVGRTVNVDEQVTENAIVLRVEHTDTEMTASASLIKYDRDGATPLAKAWFALEKKNSDESWSVVPGFEYIKTGRDGTVIAEDLKFGTYRFKEIIAPIGYVIDEADRYSDEIVLDATTVGMTLSVTKTNERVLGSATLRKYSDDGIPLNGAKFDLYMVNGEIDPSGTLNNNGTITDNYSGAPENDPEDIAIRLNMSTETVDGQVGMLQTITGLDWGRYYFKEFSSPGGYIKDNTIYCFEITAENAAVVFDRYKPENKRQKGEVILNKIAGEQVNVGSKTYNEGNSVPGAVFSLYTSAGETVYVKPKTKTVTDPITGDETVVNCFTVCEQTDSGAVSRMTGDENGQIRVDEIPWGSFYFEEVEAPEGFALGEKVRFTVNAASCLAVQELECEDFAMKCLIRIDKEIDNKLEVFGTPTFTFKVRNTDTDADYTRMITLSGDALSGSTTIQVPVGHYRVEEVRVHRYRLVGTEYVLSGTTVPAESRSIEDNIFTFTLSSESGVPQTAEVKFTNSLDNYFGISHTDAINNIIPSKRKMTGFSLELEDEYIQCSRNQNDTFVITKDMLSGSISYDDGTSEPMDETQLAAVLPENWTIDNGFANAGQSFMLNAQYTPDGDTRVYKTNFTATVGPYKVIESQKVIFRADVDNKSVFEIGGKLMGVNTVYYNSDDSDNKVVVSGEYITPTVVTGDGAVVEWEILSGPDAGLTLRATNDAVAKYLKDNYDSDLRELELRAVVKNLIFDFDYTGEVEEFIAPFDGIYYIEGWGAQGGDNGIDEIEGITEEYLNISGLRTDIGEHYSMGGGAGGYSYGYVYLRQGERIYVAVGGKGKTAYNIDGIYRQQYAEGGWNGGADAEETYLVYNSQRWFYGSGGGATHFASAIEGSGVLADYNSNRDEILLVAGGGGGNGQYSYITNQSWNQYGKGGYGGGETGGPVTNRNYDGRILSDSNAGGGQNGGGSGQFGKGSLISSGYAAGGGGGWYGGTSIDHCGATGGSGHVNNNALIMGETIGGNNTFKAPDGTDETGHVGDGHARITYQNSIDIPYTGQVGSFTAPVSGLYQLEAWGAQGGDSISRKDGDYTHSVPGNSNAIIEEYFDKLEGGNGGYSYGTVYLTAGQTIYYAVGGKGETNLIQGRMIQSKPGGFNGGGGNDLGDGSTNRLMAIGTGGGATHFALKLTGTGVLSAYSSSKNDVLLVAGGGGGSAYADNLYSSYIHYGTGGSGGGLQGNSNYNNSSMTGLTTIVATVDGGGQEQAPNKTMYNNEGDNFYINGATFGIGAGTGVKWSSGGGGGWYGGAGSRMQGGAGGSGHVGDNMVSGETIGGNNTFAAPDGSDETGHSGNGYARITLLPTPAATASFDYTGTVQTFTAPKAGKYLLEAWGAQGSDESRQHIYGGKGGYTSGVIQLDAGETVYAYVGQSPESRELLNTEKGQANPGGWNGGGSATLWTTQSGTGGGGATDFRLVQSTAEDGWSGFESLKSRIMVAGGGGGGSRGGVIHMYTTGYAPSVGVIEMTYQTVYGGYGGGLSGGDGSGTYQGYGAKQTKGGLAITTGQGQNDGAFGKGGNNTDAGTYQDYGCNGGGGGYYGGSASIRQHGAGGGGSSFISGYAGCDAITEDSTENNIVHTGQPNHYSGKVFATPYMIDGTGTMTQPDGTVSTGHSGNGYARVTYLG